LKRRRFQDGAGSASGRVGEEMPRGLARPTAAFLACLGAAALTAGCELQEVTVVESDPVLLVESYVQVGDGIDQVFAFLHWTLGEGAVEDLALASVDVTSEVGDSVSLGLEARSACVFSGIADQVEGVCFSAGRDVDGVFSPGERVALRVRFPDGQEVAGESTIPGNMEFIQPGPVDLCVLPPGRQLILLWNVAQGAWAYSAETEISGLRDALAAKGIEVEVDSVALRGLAVSESDTTLVFPAEFGVFSRFDLQQEVALALQEGLPEGALAEVAVAAVDRNYANWVRGGNFNPSGSVRVSSLRGDGFGVFGTAVRRNLRVVGAESGSILSSCLPGS